MEFAISTFLSKTFALGFVGGLLPDILRIVATRFDGMPQYLRSPFFWTSLFVLAIIGGVVSSLLFTEHTSALDSLAVGYSAPSILSKLMSTRDTPIVAGQKARPEASPTYRPDSTPSNPGLKAQIRSWWST